MTNMSHSPQLPDELFLRDRSYRILHNANDVGWVHAAFRRYAPHSKPDLSAARSVPVRLSLNLLLEGTVVYGAPDGIEHTLGPGHFIIYVPGNECSTRHEPSTDSAEFFLCFDKCTSESFLRVGLIPTARTGFLPITQSLIGELLQFMNTLERPEYELPTDAVLRATLAFIDRMVRDGASGGERSQDTSRLIEACRLLEMPRYFTASIHEIARLAGIEYQRFRKLFRQEMGCSAKQYQIRNRIRHACGLLRSEMSVKEVAFAMEYCDPYTFSFQFKKYMGMAPSEYRRLFGV